MPATDARTSRLVPVLVLLLALAAGGWAVVGSSRVFPYLSDDHDEGLYLYQADALAHGDLFPRAPRHPEAFAPWLSVLSEGRFILKYTPVHASILAAAIKVGGSPRWALGVVAAGLVLLTYGLAKEVFGQRRPALIAALFLSLSPLFVIQSATFLSYCSSLLLLVGFAFALLRGLRTDRRSLLVLSGLVLGLATFARPFDAAVFALPIVGYAVWSGRRDPRRLLAMAGWFATGLAVPLLLMFAYFRAATGSFFRSPFNLLEPHDTLGFGTRRLVPGAPNLIFTPAHGIYGVVRYAMLISFWGFGGLLLVGFFLTSVLRRKVRGPVAGVALVILTYSAGYLFFWGTFGTSLRGTLTSFLGPFYFLPVLVPICLLAGLAFSDLWRYDRFMGATAFAVMAAVSGYLLVRAVGVNLDLTADDRRLHAAVAEADLGRSVVLLPPLYGPTVLHPFNWFWQTPRQSARTIYAIDRGEAANLSLLRDYPDRTPYRLVVVESHLRANPPDPRFRTGLERLRVVTGQSVEASVTVENPSDDPEVVLGVAVNGLRRSYVLDTSSTRGKRYEVPVRIAPTGVEVQGWPPLDEVEAVPSDEVVRLSLETGPGGGAAREERADRPLAFRVEGDVVSVLFSGRVEDDARPPPPIGPPRPVG